MAAPLTALADAVSARVLAALDERTNRFSDVGEALPDLLEPARSLLGGGKRLRAQLCGAGWAAAGKTLSVDDPVVLAGSALELFQGAALVHDDVMDDSSTRRGKPAAHRHFAAAHRERGWLGGPGEHGQAAAIVLGDLLLALSAMELDAATSLTPPSAGGRGRHIYDEMIAEVALGQYLDVRSQALPWGARTPGGRNAVDLALQVVCHKSARYSVEHPLVLGAALAGAEDGLLDALRAVGLPLGEAFQLRDDELGVFGDPSVTGKPAGDDLREGKRTVLLAMTVERADASGRELVRELVGAPDLDAEGVAALQQLMRSTGALAEHEVFIDDRYAAGLSALESADVPRHAQDLVRGLAAALVRRTA
ncbi:polyprenyl synthetase family protein [Georgenia halophila]|uniref:Polyprenyl synthetase family protein n=1 Tax=Georgenia halophila TaxID=620889 RepID=A0ABP8LR16_9MICO